MGVQEKEKRVLPHFYRMIPARIRENLLMGMVVCIGILLVLSSFGLYFAFNAYNTAKAQRAQELTQLKRWEKAFTKHPSYPQAYYNAAVHAARLGDTQKASDYIQKALILNENYEPAKELKKIVGE